MMGATCCLGQETAASACGGFQKSCSGDTRTQQQQQQAPQQNQVANCLSPLPLLLLLLVVAAAEAEALSWLCGVNPLTVASSGESAGHMTAGESAWQQQQQPLHDAWLLCLACGSGL